MPQNPAGGEKTETATPRRRDEVRRRGQVARSVDLTAAIMLLIALLTLALLMPPFIRDLLYLLRALFYQAGTTSLTPADMPAFTIAMLGRLSTFFLPLFLVLFVIAVLVNAVQVGVLFSTESLEPRLEKINPITGFQRMFSMRSFVELVKSLLKLTVISLVAYLTVRNAIAQFLVAGQQETGQIMLLIAQVSFRVAFRCTLALLVIGILDYGFQRYQYEQDIMMTREEVRQETKDFEGDPQIRARVRRVRRQLAQQRMMGEVPTADVVVTNPTFLAIAIRYDMEAMSAPQVVAKGARLMAERIRTVATEHAVPIVENPALAQTLFQSVEVNQSVPAHLYRAVAEVLAFVFQINQRSQRKWADLRAGNAAA